jgi:enoyl-CoA hydratase/carnithine racemase
VSTVQLGRAGAVAHLVLNRPERLNAIDAAMKRELHAALDALEADAGVNAIVISGAGRAFSSGMDLKDDAAGSTQGVDGWRRALAVDLALIMRFWDCPKPTIAAVHGFCLAAACELAMACDITIAEEGTYLGEPELRFGSVITAMLMPLLVGPKLAKELLLSADDRIGAERAERIGLVNRVVPRGEGVREAMALAQRIARLDADGVRLTKEAINRSAENAGLRETLRANLDLAVQLECLETPSRRTFKAITQREGLKAALAWRDSGDAAG